MVTYPWNPLRTWPTVGQRRVKLEALTDRCLSPLRTQVVGRRNHDELIDEVALKGLHGHSNCESSLAAPGVAVTWKLSLEFAQNACRASSCQRRRPLLTLDRSPLGFVGRPMMHQAGASSGPWGSRRERFAPW